ncbi:NAD-dependent epimerase/dehydratase family protein [Vibrio splendidus]|uniref:NAD-dependent epimerase/dehydratase family protein n=1 Tax=Vibrio splendidus TaxID=29497 RepID=A0A7Y4D5T7_VIBSP|nr:NAD-dependent epimerase/dehydratase family protein [Vibrio splendidus]
MLLTGASGFIGSYVNETLAYRCVIAVRKELPNINNSKQVKLSELLESKQFIHLFDSTKVVIHLANLAHAKHYDAEELKRVNVDNTLELARRAAKSNVKRFVYVSSIVVNGSTKLGIPFNSKSEASPSNDYAKSKYEAESGLLKIAEETGLEVVIIRPTLVYGHRAPANVGSLIHLVKCSPVLPFGSVTNKRDFIAVQNLADLLLVCAEHPNAANQIFLASDCKAVSTKDFTNAIAQGLDKSLIQLPIPVSLMKLSARLAGKSAMAEHLLGNLQVDSSNTQAVLDWIPPYTMKQVMASLSEN